jgi:hypothetical protein
MEGLPKDDAENATADHHSENNGATEEDNLPVEEFSISDAPDDEKPDPNDEKDD